jgi:hypothetical protein
MIMIVGHNRVKYSSESSGEEQDRRETEREKGGERQSVAENE